MANVTFTPEVDDVLRRSTITGNQLVLPSGQLDRKLYESVNKVLVNAGGKWSRSAKAHIFSGDPLTKLGLVLETGVSVDEKKKFQAFFTPEPLARRVAEMADVAGCSVLEPSCGEGSLADACICEGAASVHCIDINPEFAAKVSEQGFDVVVADFLTIPAPDTDEKKFDRVVMNPPFTKKQDIKHVKHALGFLKPDGVLVSVILPHRDETLAELFSDYVWIVEDVPAGTFKESGTSIATRILTIRV